MPRKLGDWLTSYLELCDNTEPPLSYHTWVGISSIAAALQRKVWLRWGHSTLYPNLYVVLIGPSGRCRKGTAIDIGRSIVKEAGVLTTAETLTRERLIRAMAEASISFNDPETRSPVFHCSLYTISEELSVFLGQNDVKFLADLTDWYDARSEWKYETKGSGSDNLQNLCFNLLGATAPDWLVSILPSEAIGGGFTSRIIFVVEERKRKTVPTPQWTQEEEELRDALIHDLEIIKSLTGEFTMSDEAKQVYTDWYIKQDKNAERGLFPIEDPRFSGYCERRPTHVRKLAISFSSSRSNSLVVERQDFERALTALESVERKMSRVFAGLGEARYGKMTQEVLDFIRLKGYVSRTEVMQVYYRDIDRYTLDIIEKVLETMKAIALIHKPEENEVYYRSLETKHIPTLKKIGDSL